MTEQEEITYIKEHHKSPISFDDYTNYLAYIAAVAIVVGGCVLMITSVNNPKLNNNIMFTLIGLSLAILGFFILFLVHKRLKKNRTYISLSWKGSFKEKKDTIINIASKTLRVSQIEAFDENEYVRLYTKTSLTSWGEYVTVICTDNEILINSRPPSSQFLTLYKDRQNVKKLIIAFEEFVKS